MSPSRNAIAGMALPVGETSNAVAVEPRTAIDPSSTRTARRMAIRATIKKGLRMLSSIDIHLRCGRRQGANLPCGSEYTQKLYPCKLSCESVRGTRESHPSNQDAETSVKVIKVALA